MERKREVLWARDGMELGDQEVQPIPEKRFGRERGGSRLKTRNLTTVGDRQEKNATMHWLSR